MPKLIGIDTGGTYTDAVIFSDEAGVLGKAKALTTRQDLSIGIGGALTAAMQSAGALPDEIGMVSLSTTLATNAIVEGLGDRVGLVLIGFTEADLARAGLREALSDDKLLFLAGGHDSHGSEVLPLDTSPLPGWIPDADPAVSAYAVAAQFSVANPAHEMALRDLLQAATGRPVTCSHELSANLNAPKRALTSLLNARLIGTIHHLIDATEALLRERAIRAPVMVVKGDGSLISAAEARRKPIETILSGPAASIVGAGYLTGLGTALVSDIGGTTTDVAVLRNGRPRLDPKGARVGGWSTMVEAVAVHTVGLGGDSETALASEGGQGAIRLGPRRVIPVSLLAREHSAAVHPVLDLQLALPYPPDQAGRFAVASGGSPSGRGGDGLEAELLDRVSDAPVALTDLLGSRRDASALRRLVGRGAVRIAGFCPSDAAHVLGLHSAWDREAAVKAATLFARQRTTRGDYVAAGAEEISARVVEALVQGSAETLFEASLAEDGDDTPHASDHPLVQAAFRKRTGLVELGVRLTTPIIALGASAGTYYPAVAERLNSTAVIPEHAKVANAVGAVVGSVTVRSTVTISRPSDGVFRVQLTDGARNFAGHDEAAACAEDWARQDAIGRAEANGARNLEVTVTREENAVTVNGQSLFLEMKVTATAAGRPGAV